MNNNNLTQTGKFSEYEKQLPQSKISQVFLRCLYGLADVADVQIYFKDFEAYCKRYKIDVGRFQDYERMFLRYLLINGLIELNKKQRMALNKLYRQHIKLFAMYHVSVGVSEMLGRNMAYYFPTAILGNLSECSVVDLDFYLTMTSEQFFNMQIDIMKHTFDSVSTMESEQLAN